MFARVSGFLRETRWLLGFLRRRDVERRWHLVTRYLQLRALEHTPGWRPPLHVLGYQISYPSAVAMRWVFGEIFINRDYETAAGIQVNRVVDAGANVGLAAVFFRHSHPDAEIVCFEPDPRAYEYLVRNLQQNAISGVETHNIALGEQRGTAVLYVNPDAQDTCQSLSRDFAAAVGQGEPDEIAVEVAPLREYITGSVDVLKIDVEGSELQVLLGALDLLRAVKSVVMEYHRLPENPLHEVLGALAAAGHQYEITTALSAKLGAVTVIRTQRDPGSKQRVFDRGAASRGQRIQGRSA